MDTITDMLPRLPRPEDEAMPAGGGSFEDRVLLLLSAATSGGGVLTYPEYEVAASAVRKIFGERALNAGLQARFHFALLNPPSDAAGLAAALAREAAEQQVSAEMIQALLAGLDDVCARQADEGARRLREAAALAFEEESLVRRRDALEREKGGWGTMGPMGAVGRGAKRGAQAGVKVGRAAVDGAAQLAHSVTHSVADLARKALPGVMDGPAVPGALLNLPVAAFNARMAEGAEALARAAWALDEPDLRRELADFRLLLKEQPFRVVLVGEGKRGKSSLVNALLGEELSPVRESVPETAAVAEFFYSPEPRYAVRFLDEERFAHLEQYLAGEEGNPLLRAKAGSLRDAPARPRGLATLASRADILDYLSVGGRFSAFTSGVAVGLPAEILAGGMTLVDTPGLNATDSFQDYLAYEESLTADCLVFVLDARRPDSASELRLLRKLAAAGRAVSIIGVMTGADRLNESESLEAAEERALTVLREACRGAEHLRVLGLVSINAREAMRESLGLPPENKGLLDIGAGKRRAETKRSMDALLDLLREAMRADPEQDAYRARVTARAAHLAALARERSADAFARYRASLPPAQFLELLERHADRLAEAARAHAEQARSVVMAAAHDVDEWRVAQWRALDSWEETLTLRVMEAARRRADQLGANFAKESAWKAFDADEAPRIARQSIDEFLAEQRDILRAWQEKLRLFGQDMAELSALCLRAVEESAEELGDICSTTGGMDHFLVQTNLHMRRLAVFLTGAGAGAVLAGSLLNLVALGSAAVLLLTNPLVVPGVALAGVAVYALSNVGSVEKRKAAFLERKQKKTRQWAAQTRKLLEAELQSARDELAASYKATVARGFVPALEILVDESVHLRLYLHVMDKIREDAGRFEEQVDGTIARFLGD